MTDHARWRRIQDLFAAALDLPSERRAALLDAECAGDEDLRREVASLLVAHDRTGAVDRLALDVLSPAVGRVRATAAVEPGRVVSHYVVLEVLGAGGMGVVCRARDERLHRLIALKFLPPHLAADPAAKRRFLVEARAAAALEHPNVCTIYDVGETSEGQLYLAMPLYEGETLQTRLARGRLPVGEAVRITRELAAGLAAAHQQGIVHRDIKPSNVMLLTDGRVKILDFGVAKVKDVTLTATGTPVGTVAYMSPEQTRGETVDHRVDIWALGVVLYEMLTGRLPFESDTSAAIAHAICARPHLPPSELRHELPSGLDDVIVTALAKTPERRFASVVEMSGALETLDSKPRPPGHVSARAVEDAPFADHGAPLAERRRAVVVVSVIADYASLLERLEPADLEEAIAAVRAAAVDAARRHGGLVNQALGEEIVSLFGIPATGEDDDTRAVRAALELHGRVRAISTPALQRAGLTLGVQTGIDSGSLVTQRLREGPRRYSVSGSPAQIAARLASLSPPDGILISPDCQRIVRPFIATDAARPVELQPGMPPATPHLVLGESGAHSRLEASDRATLAPFTGRAGELATLSSVVDEGRAGSGRIGLVVGEAGMGKSRIIHELRERVNPSGMRVLVGRCRSYGGISPYLPIIEVLRDILDPHGENAASQMVPAIRAIDPSLEPFVPLYLHLLSVRSDEFPVPRHLYGEHLHAAMVDAVVALIIAVAQASPLLLLLEDWHWADDASREVLQRVAEIVDSLPIAIVVATRPEADILAEIGSRGTIVQLGPLERAGTLSVLRALIGGDRISDTLVKGVHERTGGNPFFVEQVAHTLREEAAIVTENGETRLTRGIDSLRLPDSVQAVIRARLDRLDGDAREVLRMASVIGREFDRALLMAAVPQSIDTARALERLRAAALIQQVRVVPDPVYRFKNILTQEVAYGSLLEHQRKTAHGRVGRALERRAAGRLDEHAEALAHHFGQAEAWEEAVTYGWTAANRLRALSQYSEALVMLERLQSWVAHFADEHERRERTAEILLQQERLGETLGQRQRQQEIITAVISLLAPHGASSKLAEAYLRQGDLLTLLKRFDAAERALNTVLRLSRDRGDRLLERNALRSVGLLRWHQGRHHEALAIAEQTHALNEALGDDAAVIGDLANIGNILRALGEYDRAQEVLERAVAMPAAERELGQVSTALHNLANVYRARGDLERALDCLQRADDAMRVNMLPIQRSFHLTAIANIRLQQGDVQEAVRTYRQAVELSRRARHAEGLAQALRMLGELQFAMGDDAEAAAHLAEAATLFAQLEHRASEADMLTQVATLRERLKDWPAAREAWLPVRRLRQALGDRAGELAALEGIARATRHLGDRAAAVQSFEEAMGLATSLPAPNREMALHNTLGILHWEGERYFDALGHYEAALRLCRAQGDRAHEGLMLNSMGVTLARLQRHEEARTVLEESVALNRANGERLLEAHALTALGEVSLNLGRIDSACDCLETAAALRRELGDNAAAEALLEQLAGLRTNGPANTPGS